MVLAAPPVAVMKVPAPPVITPVFDTTPMVSVGAASSILPDALVAEMVPELMKDVDLESKLPFCTVIDALLPREKLGVLLYSVPPVVIDEELPAVKALA